MSVLSGEGIQALFDEVARNHVLGVIPEVGPRQPVTTMGLEEACQALLSLPSFPMHDGHPGCPIRPFQLCPKGPPTGYALAHLGAILLPLDHRWTSTEIQAVADAFGARLVIVEAERPRLIGGITVVENAYKETAVVRGVALDNYDALIEQEYFLSWDSPMRR